METRFPASDPGIERRHRSPGGVGLNRLRSI